MHTRSSMGVSPVSGDSSSSSDEEADAGLVRGRRHHAVGNDCNSKVRGVLAARKVPNRKARQASSRIGRTNVPVKKSRMKKVPKHQGIIVPKTRFSVHRIREHKFSQDQIGWIVEAGFGALLAMSEFSIPAKLVAWIMKHVNTDLREFRLEDKVIVFDRQLVCNILGVPSGEEPVKLTSTADQIEAYQKIRQPFMVGSRGKLPKCIEVLTKAKDKDTFMRAFMLLALGTVLCPGTDNATTTRYLYNFHDISKIKSFDWAGHILDVLMKQVEKYQTLNPQDAERPILGSCLAVLAIAYMDHLDIPDWTTHTINYSVPRICHVTNEDFKFVSEVDKSMIQLNAFGQQPFRKTNPYPTLVPMTGHIPSLLPMPEETVVPSLKDWPDCSGTSSHHPLDTPAVAIEFLPEEYQVLLAEHNSLVEKDVDELTQAMAATMKEQTKVIMAKRGAEFACKISHLNKRLNDVADLATKMCQLKKPSNDNANVHPPAPTDPPAESQEKTPAESKENTSSPLESTGHASTSTAPIPPEERTHETTPSSPPIPPENTTKDQIPSPPPILPDESTKGPILHEPSSPSFVHEPESENVCEERSRSSTSTGDTTIEASNDTETVSSTIEKRNIKKRKRIHVGLGLNKKERKPHDNTKEIWNKFLAKRAFDKGLKIEDQSQPPPFIEIYGFHVTYDELYDSFKAGGLVGNNVMALWTYQFNLDQLQLFEEEKTRERKFAFPQLAMDYLNVDPASFNHDETCKNIYTNINETFPLTEMELMFFPIVFENHWVLLCVSMLMKQIAFFDSLSASKESTCLKCAQNLILNFAATTLKYGFLKDDVSHFEWIYPAGYPKQNNLFDCGLYTMDYMDAWNGKEMVASSLEKGKVLEFRKHAAVLLLLSAHNMVKLDDFLKKCDAKET